MHANLTRSGQKKVLKSLRSAQVAKALVGNIRVRKIELEYLWQPLQLNQYLIANGPLVKADKSYRFPVGISPKAEVPPLDRRELIRSLQNEIELATRGSNRLDGCRAMSRYMQFAPERDKAT